MEHASPLPHTEVLYGAENTVKAIQRFQSNAKETWCVCVEKTIPALSAGEKLRKGYVDGKARGVKIRYVTEMTKDNLEHCKKIMEVAELRHLAGITGTFAVTESECAIAYRKEIDSAPFDALVYSNLKEMVRAQQNIFDAFWNNAMPAEQRIKEIEEGVEPEKTEFFYGAEATTSSLLGWFSRIRESLDIVANSTAPSVAMGFEPFRNAFIELSNKGVKIRWITEITKDNVRYYKEAMKLGIEFRHLDGTKGAFGVSEKEYGGSGALEAEKPLQLLMIGTDSIIREQHQFLFDTLWKKAIPVELRIREIEEGVEPEKTEFFYGAEATTAAALEFFRTTKASIDVVISSAGPSVAIGVEIFRNAYISAKERGVKVRWITEVTKENLQYCKDAMKVADVEIRHLDEIKGNFGINETKYTGVATAKTAKPIPTMIVSTVKTFREQQQYVFDTLWNKAMPVEQKIREIEEEIEPEKTEVITSPDATERIYGNIIGKATQKIMLIIPSANAFEREKKMGIIGSLKEASKKGVKVRMLVYSKEDAHRQDILDLEAHGILVNQSAARPPQQAEEEEEEEEETTRVTAIIVDSKTSLVIELKDDEKENFADAIGTATLSTGRALASSYDRIFESLWRETSLSAQLKETGRLQKEFINIAAHELRTPITPILMSLYAAEQTPTKAVKKSRMVLTKEQADIVQRNAHRLQRLANDILTVSRLEARGIELQKETGDLNDWIKEEVINVRALSTGGSKIDIDFRPTTDLPIYADKLRVLEVLSNLIRNAIRFSPDGGKIKVTAKRSRDEPFALISVVDKGEGIDPEVMPRLFQKFASSYDYGSTGLGLFICKAIVEAHGGKITGENNKGGKGATFLFTLPLVRSQ